MTQSTCAAHGCPKPPANRGYCWGHYMRLRRYGTTDAAPDPICAACGIQFARGASGPVPNYCGTRCRYIARSGNPSPRATERRGAGSEGACIYCGAAARAGSKYCAQACRTAYSRDGESLDRMRECPTCPAVFNLAARYGNGRRVYRKNARRCRRCQSSARPNRYGLSAEAIAERDGTTCRWCLADVDMTLAGTGSKWGPSIDHRIPWARGGDNSPENLQLMHRVCNAKKGTAVL